LFFELSTLTLVFSKLSLPDQMGHREIKSLHACTHRIRGCQSKG